MCQAMTNPRAGAADQALNAAETVLGSGGGSGAAPPRTHTKVETEHLDYGYVGTTPV